MNVHNLATPEPVIKNATMFKLSWWFLGLMMLGYFIGDYFNLPVSLFALGGALVFLAIANHYKAVKPLETTHGQVVVGLTDMVALLGLV